MLNAGFEGGGNCDLPLGRRSNPFRGEVGDGATGVWLADEVLIDCGRTLFVRRSPVVDVGVVEVILLLRLCVFGCEVLTLDERARPVDLVAGEAVAVEGARFTPDSVAARRAASMAGVVVELRCASGLAEGNPFCTDCVRVCDFTDGARPNWLDPGNLVDKPRESFEGGGIALLSACRALSAVASSAPSFRAISGSLFSRSPTSWSASCSVVFPRVACGNVLIRLDFGEVLVGVGRPENPGCRAFSANYFFIPWDLRVVPRSLKSVCFGQPPLQEGGESRAVDLGLPL